MQAVTPRRTFGQKNSGRPLQAAAPEKRKASSKGGGTINPLILAGGGAFALVVFGVLVLGGAPSVPQGGAPSITELPASGVAQAPKSAQPPKPAPSGGKFGAASDALAGPAR